jgi:hypothetical protein
MAVPMTEEGELRGRCFYTYCYFDGTLEASFLPLHSVIVAKGKHHSSTKCMPVNCCQRGNGE